MIDWGRYPSFTAKEFACRHCGANDMRAEFMGRLQELRNRYGQPMRISSGYRCTEHPIEAKKPEPGPHTTGLACDVVVDGAEAYKLLRLVMAMEFKGVGVQQKGAGRFLHLDSMSGPGRVWSY